MRRWHEERELMMHRWRLEIAKHEFDGNGYPSAALPPLVCDDACHCYRGMGYFRKRHPLDCGNPRCGVCHFEKFADRARRKREQREAFRHEWSAEGGW